MTYGVLFPKIIIPKDVLSRFNTKQLEHILLHELIHIKRYDVLFNFLGMIVCIIHWLNPFAWYVFFRSKKDCELACDEGVLHYLTDKEYIEYGRTLIDMLEFCSEQNRYQPVVSKALINDRSEANARIVQISNFTIKRKSVIIFSLVILLFVALMGLNEDTCTRPTLSHVKVDLTEYLQISEYKVRRTFGVYPIHKYILTVKGSPYFILSYNVLGTKVQFWYDGTIGDSSRKTLEITTSNYKGIYQGMSLDEAMTIAKKNFTSSPEVKALESYTEYTFQDQKCHIMILVDTHSNKVYSITLY